MNSSLNNLSKQDYIDILKFKIYPCKIKLNKRFVKALKDFNTKYKTENTIN